MESLLLVSKDANEDTVVQLELDRLDQPIR